MKKPWLEAIGIPAVVCAVLTFGTGCGALKAAANPKVAWAINDPAPMSVVVRRAEVAEKTSKEVDRLMTETPANDDSQWLTKVGPAAETVTKDVTEIKANELYAGTPTRVVAAEIWAKELAQVEPKNAKPAPVAAAPAAAPVAAAAPAPAAPAPAAVAQNDEPAAPAAKEAKPKGDKKGKKKGAGKKGKNVAKAEPPKEEAAPVVAAAPPPEPPPPPAPPPPPKYGSLLGAIDPALATEWAKVMEKKRAMGDAKGQIVVLEAANDAKETSLRDKNVNRQKIKELEKSVDSLEKEAEQLSKDFIPKAKAAAQKAPADVQAKFGSTIVNLRAAVGDADISNSAAAVRYPMAATTMLDSAKAMAKYYVADVIEEKTGKRPSTASIQPGVTMDGGKVNVTLNGLSAADMGKIDPADLTKEVAARTTAWATRALGLLGKISATKEVLGFEDEVLGALMEGFTAAGWKAPAPSVIPDGSGQAAGAAGGGSAIPSAPSAPKLPSI